MFKDITLHTVKTLVIAVALFALYTIWSGYQRDMAELQNLRDYKTSVENRQQVSDVAQASFQDQKQSAENQKTDNQAQRVAIANKTAEIAREDKASADFLATPIPDRLRQADREARLARGLGAGQPAR